jgi:hypothetical protein
MTAPEQNGKRRSGQPADHGPRSIRSSLDELCAKESVDQTVIQGKREVDAFRDGDPAGPRDDSLVLAPNGKNAGLAGINDCFEAVSAAPTDVGKRERNRCQISLQQPAHTGATDGLVPRERDFINRFAREIAQHRDHDPIGKGDHETDVDARHTEPAAASVVFMPTIEDTGMREHRLGQR